jgi:hypothetical protein
MRLTSLLALAGATAMFSVAHAQDTVRQTTNDWRDAFRQLEDEDWPTPNEERRATGAPGHAYWQQQVDYVIDIHLDEDSKRLTGTETITYTNNAPDTLDFLWFQLDQNRFRPDSMAVMTETVGGGGRGSARVGGAMPEGISARALRRREMRENDGYGHNITRVEAANGEALDYTIVDTNMRIDLAEPLQTGDSVTFTIDWNYRLIETQLVGGRAGFECFEDDYENGDCIYQIAQWFPRAHAFTDYEGWTNKPFLGRGEFTLEFGDYEVSITVPEDFIVSSSGELQNAEEVLTAVQRQRLEEARDSEEPVFIVTPDEARENETRGTNREATWTFRAESVRDFAWAASRKFIWDAVGVEQDGQGEAPDLVMAMSFYPNESEPLWSTFSTRAVEHTIDVYNEFAFPYPYPTAQSVAGPQGGMEYPMITFNGGTYGRPVVDDDGNLSYSLGSKRGLIGVIIHEIGHIYFPMVVNSDERQWTWMDEGLNSFLQFQAERLWEEDYPVRRGDPHSITSYMASTNQMPIMTQSDSILQFGANAYSKPTIALVVLRETVLGRELFDDAFRTFAQRWRMRRPTPYDFFRTMEEVSGVDLDWYWRGWFYSTDHVDISIDRVVEGQIDTENPAIENEWARDRFEERPESLTQVRNREDGLDTYASRNREVIDFYSENDRFAVTNREEEAYESLQEDLEDWQAEILASGDRLYYIDLSNQGGVVMPVILKFTFDNGRSEIVRIPAEVWRYNPEQITWTYRSEREVVQVELDPLWETADADRSDNYFPPRIEPSRLEIYRSSDSRTPNRMQNMDLRVTPDSVRTRPEQ